MKIVGRIEKIEMIDLNICLVSKIDTGAWRNSLHVDSYYVINNKLIFKIGNNDYICDNFKEVKVRSSFGREQKRYTVMLKMKLGDDIYKSSFSLTDRSKMKYACLIGRKFLSKNKFMVDVNKENINDRTKKS